MQPIGRCCFGGILLHSKSGNFGIHNIPVSVVDYVNLSHEANGARRGVICAMFFFLVNRLVHTEYLLLERERVIGTKTKGEQY